MIARRDGVALVFAALLVPAVVTDGVAGTPQKPPSRAQVESRLTPDARPASEAELASLAAGGAEPILRQIAEDRSAPAAARTQAVAALRYAGTPSARGFLEALVERKRPSSDPVDRLLVRRAAIALGWMGGPGSAAAIAPLVEHPDAEVRMDAVVALGLSRSRAAEAPLRNRLAQEPDKQVKRQIEAQLKVLAALPSSAPANAGAPRPAP